MAKVGLVYGAFLNFAYLCQIRFLRLSNIQRGFLAVLPTCRQRYDFF